MIAVRLLTAENTSPPKGSRRRRRGRRRRGRDIWKSLYYSVAGSVLTQIPRGVTAVGGGYMAVGGGCRLDV